MQVLLGEGTWGEARRPGSHRFGEGCWADKRCCLPGGEVLVLLLARFAAGMWHAASDMQVPDLTCKKHKHAGAVR